MIVFPPIELLVAGVRADQGDLLALLEPDIRTPDLMATTVEIDQESFAEGPLVIIAVRARYADRTCSPRTWRQLAGSFESWGFAAQEPGINDLGVER
jgi:hypothetical protein